MRSLAFVALAGSALFAAPALAQTDQTAPVAGNPASVATATAMMAGAGSHMPGPPQAGHSWSTSAYSGPTPPGYNGVPAAYGAPPPPNYNPGPPPGYGGPPPPDYRGPPPPDYRGPPPPGYTPGPPPGYGGPPHPGYYQGPPPGAACGNPCVRTYVSHGGPGAPPPPPYGQGCGNGGCGGYGYAYGGYGCGCLVSVTETVVTTPPVVEQRTYTTYETYWVQGKARPSKVYRRQSKPPPGERG
jgi:hypothetical protein